MNEATTSCPVDAGSRESGNPAAANARRTAAGVYGARRGEAAWRLDD
jgi:hypothetical protein